MLATSVYRINEDCVRPLVKHTSNRSGAVSFERVFFTKLFVSDLNLYAALYELLQHASTVGNVSDDRVFTTQQGLHHCFHITLRDRICQISVVLRSHPRFAVLFNT